MSEKQKKIWITGASSGIGKAVAEKFANEGWKVAVSARRKELLDELAKNPNIASFPLDVTNRDQINKVFKNILNEFSDLDVCLFSIRYLISLASLSERESFFRSFPKETLADLTTVLSSPQCCTN